MADHTILLEAWYDAAWHAVPTYNRDEVRISHGQQDQLQQASPCRLDITINNRSGTYSPGNPMSSLYGKIGRNTPVRLSVDGGFEFHGEVEAWPQRWDKAGVDFWVPITAYGITQRLGLPGQKALALSSLRRFYDLASPSPVSYWALDSSRGAVTGAITSGAGGPFEAVDWGSRRRIESGVSELAPWLGTALRMEKGTFASARSGLPETPTRVTADLTWIFETEPGELNAAYFALRSDLLYGPIGGSNWSITLEEQADGDVFIYVGAYTDNSNVVFDFTAAALTTPGPHHVRLDVAQDGADVDWAVYLDGTLVLSGTEASMTLAHYLGVSAHVPNLTSALTFGHVALYADSAPPALADAIAAMRGHAGEQAHERIDRLGDEEGIPVTIIGSGPSALLGPQPVLPPLEIMRQAAAVDLGILYEPRDSFGLAYKPLDALYNLTPAATLTWGQNELGSSLEPVPDLDNVQNDVTVTRPGGASARVVQESGPLNVQEPADDPQGVGRIPVKVELNFEADDQVRDQAGFRVWRGTQDAPRVPALTVDIDALLAQGKTSLVNDLVAVKLGDRLTVEDVPLWVSLTGVLDLQVIGRGQQASVARRLIQFNCVPYGTWNVRELNQDTDPDTNVFAGRWAEEVDTALGEAIDADDTPFDVDVAGGTWTQDADEFDTDLGVGLYIEVGGEVMQVTDIVESGGTWTFTVTRSVNGVVKSHSSGAPLKVVDAQIWAL